MSGRSCPKALRIDEEGDCHLPFACLVTHLSVATWELDALDVLGFVLFPSYRNHLPGEDAITVGRVSHIHALHYMHI